MKKIKIFISLLLSVVLIYGAFSVATPELVSEFNDNKYYNEASQNETHSEENTNEATQDGLTAESLSSTNTAEASKPEISTEITEGRDAYTKRFKMSDGTFLASQYPVAVHYKNANGEWVDYDNTLIETDCEEGGLFTKDYINTQSDVEIRLSKKTNGSKLVRVGYNGYKISWNFEGIKKKTGVVTETEDDNNPETLEKISSEVTYEGVFTDVDLQYITTSNFLKENIILNDSDVQTSFLINYKCPGLTPKQTDDKTVELYDTNGKSIFVVTAPNMMDAEGNFSDDVFLTLKQTQNGKFTLELSVSEEWIKNENIVFPVTVDPVIYSTQRKKADTFVESSTVYLNRYEIHFSEDTMIVGYENLSGAEGRNARGVSRAYLKCENLPTLNIGDKIIDAKLNIALQDSGAVVVNLHEVKSSWDSNTITWKSQPAIANYIITDYNRFTAEDERKFVSFEITQLVSQWYSNPASNFGVALIAENESSVTQKARMWSSTYYKDTDGDGIKDIKARPILSIAYTNMSGVESYYTYTSIEAGNSGVASVNNFNGNFIYSQYLTEDCGGERLPVNISLTYNSNKTEAPYSYMGNGVQTNFHLFVAENPYINDNSSEYEKRYKYFYNDADGTQHYFYFEKLSDTIGKDEDGLGYSLEVLSGSPTDLTVAKYVITDKDKNKMEFNCNGHLIRVKTPTGNQIDVAYETPQGTSVPRIKYIWDGVDRQYTFTYNSGNKLCGITDPAGRITYIDYYGNTISRILYPDGKAVYLESMHGYITQVTGVISITKIYYDENSQKRVSCLQGFCDYAYRDSYTFVYKQNETDVKDYQERVYTYQFNDYGQTTGIVSNVTGHAQFFTYAAGDETSGKNNKISLSSKVQSSIVNLLVNPSLNRNFSEGYETYVPNNNTDWVAYDDSIGHYGKGSVKAYKSSASQGVAVLYQGLVVNPGVYTLSAFSNCFDQEFYGEAKISIEVWGDNGCESTHTVPVCKSTIWERFSVTAEVPSGKYIKAVVGHTENSSGTIWFDDIQLEAGYGESSYNLLENAGFKNGESCWEIIGAENAATTLGPTEVAGQTNACYTRAGTATATNYVGQRIETSGVTGDVFSLGAWAFAESCSLDENTKEHENLPKFEIKVNFYDGNNNCIGSKEESFNPDVDSWQFKSFKAIAPGDYSYISYFVNYNYNVNNLFVTGTYCYKEDYGTSYVYDDEGNVVSTTDLTEKNSTFSYENNQLSNMVNPSGSSFNYNYDETTNLLTSASSSNGQTYNFGYDSFGNMTSSTVKATNSESKEIVTGATYTEDGNFLVSSTDASGNTSWYDYNPDNYQLRGVIDANGNYSERTYYGNTNKMSTVTTTNNILVGEDLVDVGVSSNYEYNDKDWLTKITSNGNGSLEYNFEYDAFGRTTCIKVGNQPLIITEYDGYGRPTIQTYGNHNKLEKSYDPLDRVTEIKYNNDANKSLQFYYSNGGNLTIVIDHFSETKTRYIYDLAGRVVDTRVYKTTDLSGYNNLGNWVKYYYDASTGYVTGIHHWTPEIGDRQYTYRYGNKDANEMPDQVYGVSLNGVEKQSYRFDNLGRLLTKTVNVSAGKNITYSYEYKDVGDNGTTTVVETFMNDFGTYVYEYDGNGNITKETYTVWGATAPTKITEYEYDKLGQLKLVTINGSDRYAYYYDASGNISNISYVDEAGGEHYPWYKYENANWRDQLTSFNGEAITYDEIGNPLSYRGATLTWQNGRQLAKYQKGSMIAEYKYDGNGNRISKTHNGNTYEFIYNGSNLVAMTNTGTTLFNWICDENGDYLGFTYCGVEYYYIRNLQNDVIGIKNPSGTVVVEYEYDPFGKVIATTGPLADTLGKLNPIRYRGYFYDTETGFYFLKSRYYDPETCRFINADNQFSGIGGDVLGNNMYAYCMNNPINNFDPTGNWAKSLERVSFVAGCVAIVAAAVATVAAIATAPALVPLAFSLLTVTVDSFVDGVVNAANGDSFANGYAGGTVGNTIQETVASVSKNNPIITPIFSGIGTGVGTKITLELNNIDPYSSNLSKNEIIQRAVSSGCVSAMTSFSSSIINGGVDMADETGCLMPNYSENFGKGLKVFFNVLGSAINCVWG